MPEIPELIDFPVSDDWLDYYHRQGLTPRMSPRYFQSIDETRINARIGLLAENISVLGEEVQRLRREVATKNPPREQTKPQPPKKRGVDV